MTMDATDEIRSYIVSESFDQYGKSLLVTNWEMFDENFPTNDMIQENHLDHAADMAQWTVCLGSDSDHIEISSFDAEDSAEAYIEDFKQRLPNIVEYNDSVGDQFFVDPPREVVKIVVTEYTEVTTLQKSVKETIEL